MKKTESIIVWIALLILILFATIATAGCTYTNPNPFPGSLTLDNGETLCITKDTTVNSAILVKAGAQIRIYNSATFYVNGTLTVQGTGRIHVEDCGSKIEVWGSYAGVNGQCEILYYCDTCDLATGTPYELVWGAEAWREWCCEAPLPVDLVSFSGENHYYYNIISWVTASEVNNDYFTLERSSDGIMWSSIGLIKGTNGFMLQYYDYLDYGITKSYYYRLKQTNFNGSFDYLSITIVTYRGLLTKRELFKITPSGKFIGTGHKGIIIKVYDDGSSEKIIN